MFGCGTKFGTWMRDACKRIPKGAFPAILQLGWDGGVNGQQHCVSSSCPWCVQCGNNISASRYGVYVLLFMLKAVAPNTRIRHGKQWRAVQMDVKQQYMSLVLEALRPASEHGFRCRLFGRNLWLFPVLASIVLDHKEMVDFAQLTSVRGSTFVRVRDGRFVCYACMRA